MTSPKTMLHKSPITQQQVSLQIDSAPYLYQNGYLVHRASKKSIKLAKRADKLIQILASYYPNSVSHETLLTKLEGYSDKSLSDVSVKVAIHQLRQSVLNTFSVPLNGFIATQYGYGYWLKEEVELIMRPLHIDMVLRDRLEKLILTHPNKTESEALHYAIFSN